MSLTNAFDNDHSKSSKLISGHKIEHCFDLKHGNGLNELLLEQGGFQVQAQTNGGVGRHEDIMAKIFSRLKSHVSAFQKYAAFCFKS